MQAKNCRTITSIRKGSSFESAHLLLSTLINMVYYWSIELPHVTIQYKLGVDDNTVTDWANFLRKFAHENWSGIRFVSAAPVTVDETLVAK